MKRRWLIWGIAAVMICGLHGAAAREETPAVIRLRVIARDDSAQAQAEKLRLRDAVIASCPPSCADPACLVPLARRAAAPFGPCRVEIRWWSPSADMASAPTLYITLGPGRGHNWWGVLYQDALLWAQVQEPEETGEAAPDDAAEETEQVVFVWPALAWLLHLLGL